MLEVPQIIHMTRMSAGANEIKFKRDSKNHIQTSYKPKEVEKEDYLNYIDNDLAFRHEDASK